MVRIETPDKGIYPKYVVFKHPEFETNGIHGLAKDQTETTHRLELVDDFTFVLKPISDKHARVALAAYAESVRDEKPHLAADIREVLSDF